MFSFIARKIRKINKKQWLVFFTLLISLTVLALTAADTIYAQESAEANMSVDPGAGVVAQPITPAPLPINAAEEKTLAGWGLDKVLSALSWIILAITRFFLSVSMWIFSFVIQVSGYNGFLDSTAVNVGWVMVRDVANMFFVVILLLIAFGTILGLEQYEWRKLLVKFVLAAVLVNFSRVICGLMIDAAQVVMMTFVHGVAATGGSSFIKAFNLDDILRFSQETKPEEMTDVTNIFIASVASVAFAGMVMFVIGIYLFILVARVIVLWLLIALSPVAFILSVVPQTQKYATQWWQEFGSHVIMGPALVFFLWLALVSVGQQGNVYETDLVGPGMNAVDDRLGAQGEAATAITAATGIGKAMTWPKMANFAIAIGMLLVGIKVSQDLTAIGGSMLGKVTDFGKKVATIAAGYAAGRWLYEKGTGVAGKAVKGAAWYMPEVGGRAWTRRAKNEWANVKNALLGKGAGLTREGRETESKIVNKEKELADVDKKIGQAATEEEARSYAPEREAKAEELKDLYKTMSQQMRGGVVGWFVRREIGAEKQLKKSEGQKDIRLKLAFKRVAGDSGGIIFNAADENFKDDYRREKGLLEVEEMRSAAKDAEYATRGKNIALSMRRYRDGGFLSSTMAQQIAEHGRKKGTAESIIKALQAGMEVKIDLDAKKATEEVRAAQERLAEERLKGFKPKEEEEIAEAAIGAAQTALAGLEEEQKSLLADREKYRKEVGEAARRELTRIEGKDKKTGKNKIEANKEAQAAEKKKIEDAKGKIKEVEKAKEANPDYLKAKAEVERQQKEMEEGRLRYKRDKDGNIEKDDKGNGILEEVTDSREQKKLSLRKKLGIGGMMAAHQAQAMEAEAAAAKAHLEGAAFRLVSEEEIIGRMNVAEMGKKAAEDFVKELKSKDLSRQFEDAAKKMSDILKKPVKELGAEMTKARAGAMGTFVQSMANAQMVKLQEEKTGLARRTAEDKAQDAFVFKPRYGTTSPSTAYAEYMKTKMDEFRRLDRAAAMKQATDIMADLGEKKMRGEKLDIDQQAILAASTTFLTEESWVDDQGEYVSKMLKNIQSGKLDAPEQAEEKKKWMAMAKMFHRVGWLQKGKDADGKEIDVLDAEGEISDEGLKAAKIEGKYGRKHARDLQALAMTGLDVDLTVAHNAISDEIDKQMAGQKTAVEGAESAEVERLMESTEMKETVETAKAGAVENARKAAMTKARKAAMAKAAKLKSPEERKRAVEQAEQVAGTAFDEKLSAEGAALEQKLQTAAAEKAVRASTAGAEAIVKAMKAAVATFETDYFKTAEGVLKNLGIAGLSSVDELKARYAQHADIFQFATRTFKINATDNGHAETGYNQDFDETHGIYRLQTTREGESKMRAERVKHPRSKLLNGDQFHTNGTLDYEHGIVDDFLEDVLNTTLGKVTKMIELSNINERALKGHFYIHKNEDAEVNAENYAIIGSQSARDKFVDDGDKTERQQGDHVLARGLLADLMTNWRGMALGAAKLYGHVNEREAQEGVINMAVGDMKFDTAKDMAATILQKLEAEDKGFMAALEASGYKGQEERIKRKMRQIVSEDPKADFSDRSAEDNEVANAAT